MTITNFLNRDILNSLRKELTTPYVLILIGSRRTGKTTLLKMLLQEPEVKTNALYFDLENPIHRENFQFNNYDLVARQLIQNLPHPEKRGYVFLDEIQYLENAASLLKYMFDHYQNLKFIVSGSSSLRLKNIFSDSMVGRKRVYRLYPLNFREFLLFKQKQQLYNVLSDVDVFSEFPDQPFILPSIRSELLNEIYDFLSFGGYPETTLLTKQQERIQSLFEIYTSYIQKDIRFLFSIESIDKFNKVTKILASQIGSLMNISEISNTIGLSRPTVERYAFILESTFVVSFLLPHYSNIRKELSKMPKVYFEDVGLCNAISGKFAYEPDHFFWGQLAENFVFNQLQKRNDLEIKFWRNKNKQEVDFLVFKENELIPIEVKFREQKVVRIPAGLRSFIREYRPTRAIVVTRDFWDAMQCNGTKILFLPIYLI
ncbi:MAG: ATP-binding protein [Calditrichaeota bacterium]|nr:ATP-binding protein [Calditrichota bacterium]